jgi:hypothetical protein
MEKKLKIAIVVPLYKQTFTENEQLSLSQLRKVLGKYDFFCITPRSLSTVPPDFQRINFDDHYFTSIREYSQLMLSPAFYEKFTDYTHILIYQLDALVFSDQLSTWAQQPISYIGAPWFSTIIGSLTSPTKELRGGNGGLSLRSVEESLKVLKNVNRAATTHLPARVQQWAWFFLAILLGRTKKKWLQCPADQYPFNEDGFWSFEASKYSDTFVPATQKQSLQFAFETQPVKCFELNNHQLPFGTHAWEKYDKEFWLKKLPFRTG